MAENVYIWPGWGQSVLYGDQFRVASETAADGELIGANEIAARATAKISGRASRRNLEDLRIFVNRMRGGAGALAGIVDGVMREYFGWDQVPAINAAGDEFWIIGGDTAAYAGQASNPPAGPWRSIFAQAVGAHVAGDTTIAVDQLLAGEIIPRGCMARFGDWRYVLTADAEADGTGAATLTLDQGLRADIADDALVRVPGDFMLAKMRPGRLPFGPFDIKLVGSFDLEFVEVYSDEVAAGIGSYVLP